MTNFFKREAQSMMAWLILPLVIAITIGILAAMLLHKEPSVQLASTSAAKLLDVSAAQTVIVQPSERTSQIRSASPPSASTDNKTQTSTKFANAQEPTFDRDFAAAAAKPYVEAYQRQHPTLKVGTFAWDQPQVILIPKSDDPNTTGDLGVFFPASESTGAGFTCFALKGDADHLDPISWGYALDLTAAVQNFRRGASQGAGCLHIL